VTAFRLDDVTSAPRPGWYPDPAGTADQYRWWNGQEWTNEVSPSPNAPAPLGSLLGSAGTDPPRRRSPLRAILALVVIIALFLSATLGVGLWLWGGDSAGSRSEARATPPPGPRGQLDESSRSASIGAATMKLPGDPYELRADPVPVRGIFDVAFVAEAEVHEQYDGANDWFAVVALAALDPDLADGSDPEQAAHAALSKIATRMYDGQQTKVSQVRVADRSVDGNPGVEVSARIHYAVDRLASRYDTVAAIVVRLDDGTSVAALSAVPDDADPAVHRLAQASLDSLAIN
jgi:hypothetical protein